VCAVNDQAAVLYAETSCHKVGGSSVVLLGGCYWHFSVVPVGLQFVGEVRAIRRWNVYDGRFLKAKVLVLPEYLTSTIVCAFSRCCLSTPCYHHQY
jgi:hypothetical protein